MRSIVGSPLAALLFFLLALATPAAAQTQQLRAEAYDPQCGDDSACAIWAAFRTQHPFPYQSVAAARAGDGALVVILSEPALPRADLERQLRAIFAGDLVDYSNRRWMIGQDGWVEDVVLKLRWNPSQAALANPLSDRTLRTRIAAVHQALYGTTFGGDLEPAERPLASIAQRAAPDLSLTPAELNAWLNDSETRWREVGARGAQSRTYTQLIADNALGAFIDSQNQLAIFLTPAAARASEAQIEHLRTPFRHFAIACDTLLGGAWNEAGLVTLIGRARRAPLAAVPPLRFETFSLLAREQRGELQQSYQRDLPLSGKLLRGPLALRDWAPILLSESLIDTEFGALLNIADQMLKSWSEAGRIQYVYFDYPLRPAPGDFVFGDRRLSRMITEETGASGVLFNWNTAGAAAAIAYPGASVLAAGRTSALPVTYGSELLSSSDVQTGEDLPRIRALENQAYDYFVARRDPNLARVVSYTLMFQLFRAASPAPGLGPDAVVAARAGAHTALRRAMRELIDAISSGEARALDPALQSIVSQEAPLLRTRLRAFRSAHPQYRDGDALVALLINPRSAAPGNGRDALVAEASALGAALQDVAFMMHDLGAVSAAFVEGAASAPEARVKTPSIVISWDDTDLMSALLSVGGHNLTARTLRVEIDPNAARMSLADTAAGKLLRVPPSQAGVVAANAHAIARLVEHEGGDVAAIQRLLERAAAPAVRNRADALGESGADLDAFTDKLGEEAPGQ